jgi:NADP-dependent 3-hydroxy acid dehydrogenase YdfG
MEDFFILDFHTSSNHTSMNKVVLITGGSSGIGNLWENFYTKGFIVYGTSRNPERVLNSVFPLVALDVRDTASIQSLLLKLYLYQEV